MNDLKMNEMMKLIWLWLIRLWILAASCFVSCMACAADVVDISHGWVRATFPGQDVGAAYLDIQSAKDAKLVKVQTPAAGSVEIHSMTMDKGVMKMRMLEELDLPAGKVVSLAPTGFHFMLFDLKKPLKAGGDVTFILSLKCRQGDMNTQQINLPVKAGND